MDATAIATALVTERFPRASSAFLGGSMLTDRRTPTSDLDIVVVVEDLRTPFRETTIAAETVAELFVHTPRSLREFWAKDIAARRPALVRMCAEGVVLVSTR